ncbi:MAG: DUF3347 domain-containing protein [Chitinophagaceae bacterium]|nr:MAG: DUF3347 domain-containing protein [Chitinophagaceae bacterium]
MTAFAQHDHSNHQNQNSGSKADTTAKAPVTNGSSQQQLAQMLSAYYNIKNALVTGDAASAASNADQFLRTANAIDYKVISEGNVTILSKDAGKISSTKDLNKQRQYFADLSSNMATVAKSLKLSSQPIYLQYCPMKKASWLSSEKQIRNPYYGSSMLTCGEVTETF